MKILLLVTGALWIIAGIHLFPKRDEPFFGLRGYQDLFRQMGKEVRSATPTQQVGLAIIALVMIGFGLWLLAIAI